MLKENILEELLRHAKVQVKNLISSYIKNRKQYVVFNNKQSDYSEVYTGVPQGSILGLLFFFICISDLITTGDKLKFLMYADDTTIYFNLEDFDSQNNEADINAELEKVPLAKT